MDLKPYKELARAYADLDADRIDDAISDDCIYESQFVFDSLVGRDSVMAYLRAKFEAIRKSGQMIATDVRMVSQPYEQPCVTLRQGDDAVVLLAKFNDSGEITRIDLCIAPGPADTSRAYP